MNSGIEDSSDYHCGSEIVELMAYCMSNIIKLRYVPIFKLTITMKTQSTNIIVLCCCRWLFSVSSQWHATQIEQKCQLHVSAIFRLCKWNEFWHKCNKVGQLSTAVEFNHSCRFHVEYRCCDDCQLLLGPIF